MANKIILVIGPQAGVGKTTLAANLAAGLSRIHHQPALIIDTDALCRGEAAQISKSPVSPTMIDLLEVVASQKISFPMLRGRVPVNKFNIGTIPMAHHPGDLAQLETDHFNFFVEGYSKLHDLIIDLEASNPLLLPAIDLADIIIWTLLPNALSVKSTLQHLEMLHNQKVGFHKFLFVLNQAGTPHALPSASISQALGRFQKSLKLELPHEPELNLLLNKGQPVIIQRALSGYRDGIQKLIDLLPKTDDHRSTRTSASRQNSPKTPQAGKGGSSALENQVTDKVVEERRKRWNTFKQHIHRELVEELNIRRIDLDTKGDPTRERQLRTNVESTVNELISKEKDANLSREEREGLVKELVDEALGLGPLEELLADASITEIMVNRADQIYVERKGKIILSDKRFIDNNHVIQVIRRIISPLGRRIDESAPMVDARLKDGSRVNAIIPPLAVQGPTLTIRRFPERALGPDDLVKSNSITKDMIDFLQVCVQLKKNMVISGGTGTGKTTILNMLSSFIPNDERIVTVEDTAELRMQQEHVVRLEARPANIEGQGQVSIRDLVKNCLRMRPDRIVVGECRGGEALDMLQAMNTGHDGSLTTIHANTPQDCFTRMETLCLMAGMDLPVWALREQIRSAVHLVVQLSRLQDGSRKVVCITEVTGRDDETILSQDLFRFIQDRVDDNDKVIGHYEAMGKLPTFYQELQSKGLSIDAKIFESNAQKGEAA